MSMFALLLSALISLSMQQDIHFKIKNQPVQDELLTLYETSPATKIGFGGSRGGAKSHSADDLMIFRRMTYAKTSGLFIMKTLDDIKDIHIRPMIQRFPVLDSWHNKSDKLITFPNGSFFRYLSFDNFVELKKRSGRGFADIMIDQSEQFPQEELEFLATINRHVPVEGEAPDAEPGPIITPKMLFCFNPGGISHSYHKRIFVEKNYEENEDAADYAFLQSFGWDNAFWSIQALREDKLTVKEYHRWDDKKRFEYFINRSQYGRKLNQLPDSQRQAQLLGSFDVFEGQFFSNFRRRFHVVKYERKPEFHTRGGIDYGNVSALEIVQRDFDGHYVACGEVYMPNFEGPTARATAIASYLLEHKIYKLVTLYDTDMTISQVSNIDIDIKPIEIFRKLFDELMGDKAPLLIMVNKTSLDAKKDYRHSINDAVIDMLAIRERPAPGGKTEQYSNLYISEDNPWLIKSFAELIHPQNGTGNGIDYDNTHPMRHQFDAFKHAIQGLWTPPEPKPKKVYATEDEYVDDTVFSRVMKRASEKRNQSL